jgi:ubiquinone/menaquinone biosynthesis C-methylase UbiE
VKAEMLSLLRSPVNGERLEVIERAGETYLVGTDSGTSFPVRDGIPVFIDPGRLKAENEKSRIYYDILSPFYQFTQSVYYRLKGGEEQSRNEYLRYAEIRDGDSVLEVSIGNGVNIKYLTANAEYFGVDVSWGQLKRCMQNTGAERNIELFQAEAEHLPFCDEAFDVVFNVASINYFEDKKRAIEEMFRVAKPGARMMIADETEKAARAHNKLPIFRGFFNSSRDPVSPPIDLLPSDATEIRLSEIRDGLYYCLRFRKPS